MAHRDMSDATRITYLTSEITVSQTIFDAASRILAAYIKDDKVTSKNEDIMIDKSVRMALELAVQTDKIMSKSTTGKKGI
ncbi:MAG: hypothetical protein MI673_04460 [Thiotrichales bacterium]|nr:hypothetical protein [Thiotrichales bacterium]